MTLLLAACAPHAAETLDARILPGTANIALLEGSTLYDPCEITNAPELDRAEMFEALTPRTQRVFVSSDQALLIQNAYVRELRLAGWDFEGGAGPQFWSERPAGNNCRQHLDMTGLPRDPNDDSAGVVFVFELRPGPTCRTSPP